MSTLAMMFLGGVGFGMTLMTILYAIGENLRRQDERHTRYTPSLEGWCDEEGRLDTLPRQIELAL